MAPSTTSALHPIVIPALQIPPHFTTLGAGLLFDSHARETAPTLRALLLSTPSLLENKAKPKSWWRAQCLLYGLDAPEKRTVQELRSALELALLKGELEVPAAMAQLETKERGRFRKLNAQVRDATGVSAEKKKPKETVKKETVKKAPANPAKKPLPKDPLVAVKNAGKVAKSQPATKNKSVTVNLTINMPSAAAAAAAAAPAPAKKPARAKAAAAGSAPKPRAEKKAKVAVSDPGYFASSTTQEESKPMPKQTAKRGRGGASKAAAPVQREPGAPRTKQTARCSARGGLAKSVPRVKKEAGTPAWVGKNEDDEGDVCMDDAYSNEYFRDGASDYAGYSDREEEHCWTSGAF